MILTPEILGGHDKNNCERAIIFEVCLALRVPLLRLF